MRTATEAPGWERRELERQSRYLERMSVIRQIEAHLGDIADLSKAAAEGDVLAQLAVKMPASGVYEITWPGSGFQAVSIANPSTNVLTVVAGSGGPSASAPGVGAGQFTVSANVMRTVSIRGRALTIFGASGTLFDFTAYSRPRAPSSGAC
jgi:hypothetical protein